MSFIDRTYFAGDLHISQLQDKAVQEKLDHFISLYEPKCLDDLFGYEFLTDFTNGLLETSPEQRWLDLRDGAVFTGYNGRPKKWMGLTGLANAVPVTGKYKAPLQIQVGVTTGFTANTTTVTFDGTNGKPDFRGFTIAPERIGTGTMWNTEFNFNPSTGKWDLLTANDVFQPNERFNITFEPYALSSTITTTVKKSIIANYVYYWIMRDGITSTTGLGEAQQQADNATRDNPGWKMFRAWNQMCEWVRDMDEFIRQNHTDYLNYFYHTIPADFFRTVNPMGI